MEKEKEKKKKGRLKIIIVFSLALIMPLLYFTNNTVRDFTNEFLKILPWKAGEYFNSLPTTQEKEQMIGEIANYYVNFLDEDLSAARLYIVKKEDEKLYNEIIKKMDEFDNKKTNEIIKGIRKLEMRKDILVQLYEEKIMEESLPYTQEAERIQGLDRYSAVKDIEQKINNGKYNDVAKIIEKIDEAKASEIIYYLNLRNVNIEEILKYIETTKKDKIESQLIIFEIRDKDFQTIAKTYENMDSELAFNNIGNEENYSFNDLAKIYINLTPEKSAEILSNTANQQFIENLFEALRTEEKLRYEDSESITVEISRYIDFIKNYNVKIEQLASIYEKMEPQEVADIVEKMMINNSNVIMNSTDENDVYQKSDAEIIVDVLKRMKENKVSEIIRYMESRKAAEISRRLAVL